MQTNGFGRFALGLVLGWGGVAVAQVVVEPAPAPVYVAPGPRAAVEYPALDRFSLIYTPEVALSNGSLGQAIDRASQGAGIHSLGFEYASQTGWFARYHAQLDYTYGYGLSGVRLEPLGFGWAFPLLRAPGVSLEIEPLVSLADGMLLFSNDGANNSNVSFLLSSGAEVQVNLTLGALYLFASPIGLEVRYLEVTSGNAGATYTGFDPFWRFRAGLGVQY